MDPTEALKDNVTRSSFFTSKGKALATRLSADLLRAELSVLQANIEKFIRSELKLAAVASLATCAKPDITSSGPAKPDGTSSGSAKLDGTSSTTPFSQGFSSQMAIAPGEPLRRVVENGTSDEEDNAERSLLDGTLVDRSGKDATIGVRCKPLYAWAMSLSFEIFVFNIILVFTASIGIQAEYQARHWNDQMHIGVRMLNHLFVLCFTSEFVLRMFAYSSTHTSLDYLRNNKTDSTVIVLLTLDEMIAAVNWFVWHQVYEPHFTFGILRIVRALRLVRVIRRPAFLRVTNQLRVFVISMADSIQSIVWAIVFLLTITYVFAVFLTGEVTRYKMQHHSKHDRHSELLESYGSVGLTMSALYVSILDGTHWWETALPLMKCSPWLVFAFTCYMTICILGLLNMVTSVFVSSGMKNVERDQLEVVQISMTHIFHEADTDMSGSIDVEELEVHMKNPALLDHLREIDLKPDDCRHIFYLLDTDGTGDIPIDELVGAAVCLHGPAKALDLALVKLQVERTHKLISELHEKAR